MIFRWMKILKILIKLRLECVNRAPYTGESKEDLLVFWSPLSICIVGALFLTSSFLVRLEFSLN